MRIGISGTGRIASRFADTAFAGIESAYVSCVYNPKAESAEKFAIQHRIENYTDIEEEVADVFIVLVSICNRLNINLYDAIIKKEEKNIKRQWKLNAGENNEQ